MQRRARGALDRISTDEENNRDLLEVIDEVLHRLAHPGARDPGLALS